MPNASVKSDKWFIRVTLGHETIKMLWDKALSTLCVEDMTHILLVTHVGEKAEKEHIHGLIIMSRELQKQSIDARIKKIFNVKGHDYSSKVWDGNTETAGAGSYLYHDPTATDLYVKGFTQEQLDKFRQLHAVVATIVEEKKTKAPHRCVDRILLKIKETDYKWTRQQIARSILDDIRDGIMYDNGDPTLTRYIEEIYMKQLTDEQYDKYAQYRIRNMLRFAGEEVFSPYET